MFGLKTLFCITDNVSSPDLEGWEGKIMRVIKFVIVFFLVFLLFTINSDGSSRQKSGSGRVLIFSSLFPKKI